MLDLENLPAVLQGDVRIGRCRLDQATAGTASSSAEAWDLLPAGGTGVVTLSDDVVRFSPSHRNSLLVDAEVVLDNSTVILRMDGGTWRAWRWTEEAGDSHCFVEREYRSTERGTLGEPPLLVYRHYWGLEPDSGALEPGAGEIRVWKPLGARFVGFKEVR